MAFLLGCCHGMIRYNRCDARENGNSHKHMAEYYQLLYNEMNGQSQKK